MKTFQFVLTLVCCLLVAGLSAQTAKASCSSMEKVSSCKSTSAKAVAISLGEKVDCKKGDPCCIPCPPGCCQAMAAAAGFAAPLAQAVTLAKPLAAKKSASSTCQPIKCKPADCKSSAEKADAKALAVTKL